MKINGGILNIYIFNNKADGFADNNNIWQLPTVLLKFNKYLNTILYVDITTFSIIGDSILVKECNSYNTVSHLRTSYWYYYVNRSFIAILILDKIWKTYKYI